MSTHNIYFCGKIIYIYLIPSDAQHTKRALMQFVNNVGPDRLAHPCGPVL